MLEHILNWKLLEGSHEFPGPDGGTCINEAAIVAAGFKYRAVTSMDDCPKCFSRPIAQYALCLNDEMPDDVRQLLLPFVMRLSGTADTQHTENKRIELIWIETIRRIFGLLVGKVGEGERSARLAELCRQCSTMLDAYTTAIQLSERGWIADDDAKFILYEIGALFLRDGASVRTIFGAANCASRCANSLGERGSLQIWKATLSILDDAIKLGRHRAIEPPIAARRLAFAKSSFVDA